MATATALVKTGTQLSCLCQSRLCLRLQGDDQGITRTKIFITLLFLMIYRVGFHVPVPMIDQQKMAGDGAAPGGRL